MNHVGERGKGAYDWRRWVELLCDRVLNLESANLEVIEHPDIVQHKPPLTESWKSKVKEPGNRRQDPLVLKLENLVVGSP